jgi:hypothetical protein
MGAPHAAELRVAAETSALLQRVHLLQSVGLAMQTQYKLSARTCLDTDIPLLVLQPGPHKSTPYGGGWSNGLTSERGKDFMLHTMRTCSLCCEFSYKKL